MYIIDIIYIAESQIIFFEKYKYKIKKIVENHTCLLFLHITYYFLKRNIRKFHLIIVDKSILNNCSDKVMS